MSETVKVILGKSKSVKGIEFPIYLMTVFAESTLMTRFIVRDEKLVADRIVCRFDEGGILTDATIGVQSYEKIEDTWDLSGWSEYAFNSGLATKQDWEGMRSLARIMYENTKV